MKHLILTLTILLTTQLFAQIRDTPKIGDYVTFLIPLENPKYKDTCAFVNTRLILQDGKVCYFDKNIIFQIIDSLNGNYKILALPFKARNFGGFKNTDSLKIKAYNNTIHSVNIKDVNSAYKKHEFQKRLQLGILSLPFKLRVQEDWFVEPSFNIGINLGIRFYKDCYFQFGYNIENTNLNSENSNLTENNTASVLNLSMITGIMIEKNKIQVGLYTGWDILNNQEKYQWKHHKKTWLSIGIGYNIFKLAEGKRNNK